MKDVSSEKLTPQWFFLPPIYIPPVIIQRTTTTKAQWRRKNRLSVLFFVPYNFQEYISAAGPYYFYLCIKYNIQCEIEQELKKTYSTHTAFWLSMYQSLKLNFNPYDNRSIRIYSKHISRSLRVKLRSAQNTSNIIMSNGFMIILDILRQLNLY